MKHLLRIIQTDIVDNPEIYEDIEDIQNKSPETIEIIKNRLKSKITTQNYKFQRHICFNDEKIPRNCILEDM